MAVAAHNTTHIIESCMPTNEFSGTMPSESRLNVYAWEKLRHREREMSNGGSFYHTWFGALALSSLSALIINAIVHWIYIYMHFVMNIRLLLYEPLKMVPWHVCLQHSGGCVAHYCSFSSCGCLLRYSLRVWGTFGGPPYTRTIIFFLITKKKNIYIYIYIITKLLLKTSSVQECKK